MTQFLLCIIPPVFYFFFIMFCRKNVEEPFVAKIWYWLTPVFFIPILGFILAVVLVIATVIMAIEGDIELNEGTKFYKKWIGK